MERLLTIPALLDYVCNKYNGSDLFTLYNAKNKIVEEKITYQEFPPLVKEFQALLPTQSSRIVIYLDSGPEWLKVFFAIVYSGSVAVLIDANLEPEDVLLQIKQSEASLLITDNKRLSKIEVAKISDQLPPMLNIDGTLLANIEPVISNQQINIMPTSLAAIVYTSGSTGTPKGVMLSHQAFCLSAIPERLCLPNGIRSLTVLPLWHVLGLANCLLSLMIKGCSLYFIQTMKPNLLLSTLQECQINHMTTTPVFCETIYKKLLHGINELVWYKRFPINLLHAFCQVLLKFSQKTTYHLAQFLFRPIRAKISLSFNIIIFGGARLNPEIIKALLCYGYMVMPGYGLSEACGGIVCTQPFSFSADCVGDINKWCEVKILDKDEHGIGEIGIKGKQLMAGYLNQPELTKSVYTADGWFKSGDLGYIDKNNRLYISGRSKDIIVTAAGKNVSPDDVEHYFSHLLHVDEVCVFGQDTEEGEAIVLVVRLTPELSISQTEEVLNMVKEKNAVLPGYYQAGRILLAEEVLPRTATKKIDRKKVKEKFSANIK